MGIGDNINNIVSELTAPSKEKLKKETVLLFGKNRNNEKIKNSIIKLYQFINKAETGTKRKILESQLEELKELSKLYKQYIKTKFTSTTNIQLSNLFEGIQGQINLEQNKISDDVDTISKLIDFELDRLEDTINLFSYGTIRDKIESCIDIVGILESVPPKKFQDFFYIATIEYINILEKRNNIKLTNREVKILIKQKGLKFIKTELEDFRKSLSKKMLEIYPDNNFDYNIKLSTGKKIKFNILDEEGNKKENKNCKVEKKDNKKENKNCKVKEIKNKNYKVERKYNKKEKKLDDSENYSNNRIYRFSNFLKSAQLQIIPKESPKGRFVRTLRYLPEIKEYSEKYKIPIKYLFTLVMVESYGDPLSSNGSLDGGCGILHFQPGTARNLGMKIFSRHKEYREYDSSSTGVSRINGLGIQEILRKFNYDYSKLSDYDDRFNVNICLEKGAKLLRHIYDSKKVSNNRIRNSNTSHKSWEKYKKNEEHFKWMLTLNGFNKGEQKVYTDFYFGAGHHHMRNIRIYLKEYKKFNSKMLSLMNDGLEGEKLLYRL